MSGRGQTSKGAGNKNKERWLSVGEQFTEEFTRQEACACAHSQENLQEKVERGQERTEERTNEWEMEQNRMERESRADGPRDNVMKWFSFF